MKFLDREQVYKINEEAVEWEDSITKELIDTITKPVSWLKNLNLLKKKKIKVFAIQWGAEYVEAIHKVIDGDDDKTGDDKKDDALFKKAKSFFQLTDDDKESVKLNDDDYDILKSEKENEKNKEKLEEFKKNILFDENKKKDFVNNLNDLKDFQKKIHDKYYNAFKKMEDNYNISFINEAIITDDMLQQTIDNLIKSFISDISKISNIITTFGKLLDNNLLETYNKLLEQLKNIKVTDTNQMASIYVIFKYVFTFINYIITKYNELLDLNDDNKQSLNDDNKISEIKPTEFDKDDLNIDNLLETLDQIIKELVSQQQILHNYTDKIKQGKIVTNIAALSKSIILNIKHIFNDEMNKELMTPLRDTFKDLAKIINEKIDDKYDSLIHGFNSTAELVDYAEMFDGVVVAFNEIKDKLKNPDNLKQFTKSEADGDAGNSLTTELLHRIKNTNDNLKKMKEAYDNNTIDIQKISIQLSDMKLSDLLNEIIKSNDKLKDELEKMIKTVDDFKKEHEKFYERPKKLSDDEENEYKKKYLNAMNTFFENFNKNFDKLTQYLFKHNTKNESYIFIGEAKFKLPKDVRELFPEDKLKKVEQIKDIKDKVEKNINYHSLNTILYQVNMLIKSANGNDKNQQKKQDELKDMWNIQIMHINNYFQNVVPTKKIMSSVDGQSTDVPDEVKKEIDTQNNQADVLKTLKIQKQIKNSTHKQNEVEAYQCKINGEPAIIFLSAVKNNDYIIKDKTDENLYIMKYLGAYDVENGNVVETHPFGDINNNPEKAMLKYVALTSLRPDHEKHYLIPILENFGKKKQYIDTAKRPIDIENLDEIKQQFNVNFEQDLEGTLKRFVRFGISYKIEITKRYEVDKSNIKDGVYPGLEVNDIRLKTSQIDMILKNGKTLLDWFVDHEGQ